MTTEQEKDKHVTFRAPEYLIDAVALYCRENDEKPSQFWRKAAKLRLEQLEFWSHQTPVADDPPPFKQTVPVSGSSDEGWEPMPTNSGAK